MVFHNLLMKFQNDRFFHIRVSMDKILFPWPKRVKWVQEALHHPAVARPAEMKKHQKTRPFVIETVETTEEAMCVEN